MNRPEKIIENLWSKSRFTSYFFQGIDLMEEGEIDTLALTVYSSRLTLFYNMEFTERLTDDELTGLLVHEMLHVLLNHDHRGKPDADVYLQNLAQDMVINSYIKENRRTFFSTRNSYMPDTPELLLPHGLPVVPGDFFNETGNDDPVWEDVYLWLKEQTREKIREYGSVDENDHGGTGLNVPGSSIEKLRDDLNNLDLSYNTAPEQPFTAFKNMNAIQFEKNSGDPVPTGMHIIRNPREQDMCDLRINNLMVMAEKDDLCREERVFNEICGIIESTKESDTSWQHRLRSIVDITSQSDEWEYTWHRFNKRYFNSGIYSPGRSFKYRKALTVTVDVSGSMVMKPGDIEAAFGIIEDLLGLFKVYLLCIDETVFIPEKHEGVFIRSGESAKPYQYKKGDWKYLKTGSSGTTYFAPLFNSFIKGHKELLIIITDGYIYDIDKLQKYPNTLWLISENRPEPFIPPFGRVLKIQSKNRKGSRINRVDEI